MAFLPMIIGNNGGGNTTVHPVLIGHFTSNSTSAETRTLDESIANYKYLWFSMDPITSDSVWLASYYGNAGYAFTDINYFKNNPITMYFAYNNGQSNIVCTYVSDTTFTSKALNSTTKNIYVYGIKDMPGREGNGLDIANGSWIGSDGTRGAFPISITATWCGFIANTEGYTTLTINNLNWIGVVGIKSDGTMVSIIPSSSTKYSTADITGYEYIWISHGTSASHSVQFNISK